MPIDRVVTVSDDARVAMLSSGHFNPAAVKTLPNGIDVGMFNVEVDKPALKRDLGLPEGVPVFGIVARLSWEKRHKVLLDAMTKLEGAAASSILVVVGGGPMRSELEQYAAEAGVAGRVHFLGERRDVPRLLQIFDAFVLSSKLEGLSLTLLEAAAAGLPIVATDVGGNAEVVVDGRTGFIVEPENPGALGDAMSRLGGDSGLARSMGERGRERVSEHYSLEAMVRRYDEIYHEILGKN
jgi:glycosyltransferase involved in cell wall biosynthesis